MNTDDRTIVFPSLKWQLRLVAFAFGLFVLIVNFYDFKLNAISVVMITLGLFCLYLSIIEDYWIFNMTTEEATHVVGFVLLPKKKLLPFSEIKTVAVYYFVRPLTQAQYAEIVLEFKNGKETKLGYDKVTKLKEEIANAEVLHTHFYSTAEEE